MVSEKGKQNGKNRKLNGKKGKQNVEKLKTEYVKKENRI